MSSIRIVRIDWEDAYTSELDLIALDDKRIEYEPIVASCVGFLVKETEKAYIIASEYWESENSVKYLHCIPKHSVVGNVVELGVIERRDVK